MHAASSTLGARVDQLLDGVAARQAARVVETQRARGRRVARGGGAPPSVLRLIGQLGRRGRGTPATGRPAHPDVDAADCGDHGRERGQDAGNGREEPGEPPRPVAAPPLTCCHSSDRPLVLASPVPVAAPRRLGSRSPSWPGDPLRDGVAQRVAADTARGARHGRARDRGGGRHAGAVCVAHGTRVHTGCTCSGVGVIPSRRLQSATRPHPAAG